jgi:hypothetical protein
MKRILLLSVMALFTGAMASAQCTPDPAYTSPGVYPDSATGFQSGCVNVPYQQLITNVVPVDTTIVIAPLPPITLPFDSVVITGVAGLPPGFTFVCYDGQNVTSPVDQCAFEGGTIGCVLISGTAAPGDEGTYALTIDIDAYLGGSPTPQATIVVDYYSILIETTCSTGGINEVENSKFKLYPNPVAQSFTLDGLAGLSVSEVSIMNAEGKILSSDANVTTGSIDMDVAHLESGVYFVRIAHGTSVDVVRFIKE